ncbi:CRISPR-associated protein [Thermotoga sp. SG1]|nr:CRISPR-associated protein [Thermotoga sp. SG1]
MDVMRSHPDRKLVDHLNGVKKRSLEKFYSLDLSWKELFGYGKDVLEKFILLVSESHDIGKGTVYFQDYLNGEKVNKSLRNHALFSAVAFFHRSKELPEKLRLFGFEIVRKHHGRFDDFLESDPNKDVLKKQFESLPFDLLEVYNLVDMDLSDTIEELRKTKSKFALLGEKSLSDYFLIHLFMSILVSSDREDVVFKDETLPPLPSYEKEKILAYRERLGKKNQIDRLRWEFQEEVLRFQPERGKIYSITAPTGIGKTLGNLLFASHFADDDTIVIYALPFINIIEQTVEKIREMFETDDPFFVLPFHHLSNPEYSSKYEEVEDLLINLWHSRVVVTTFVSLLESIITLRKIPFFYKLPKAVLILDEVQAIPHEYWSAVEKTIRFLSKMGTTVVLSTATKPSLLKDAQEVVFDKKIYFSRLNRTILKIEREMSFEEYKQFIKDTLKDGKRTLIITNTIKEAEEIYDTVEGIGKVCFLSSRVIPKHRMEIVSKINEYDICVTTQVVEAGVDISFERVIRDIAPVDSIVQAAGRCNRHFETKKGEVIVAPVKDKRNVLFSSYVYGRFLTDTAKKILENYETLEESEFFELVERFFDHVNRFGNPDAKKIGEALEILNFAKIGQFSLITPEPTVPFVVLVDEESERVFEEFQKFFDKKRTRESFSILKKLFRELSPYIVSARVKKDAVYPETIAGMVVIPRNVLDNWYHPIKGLRVEGSGEVIVI